MYVYIRSEPGLYTVGFYGPNGRWEAESDHNSSEDAARRVMALNGGAVIKIPRMGDVIEAISFPELVDADHANIAYLSVIFNHQVVEHDNGVWRWRKNDLMRHLEEDCPVYMPTNTSTYFRAKVSLNQLAIDFHNKKFSLEEYVKFHMQIGYSLSGFLEIFGEREATEFGVAESIESETAIEYLLRVHRDKVLKI